MKYNRSRGRPEVSGRAMSVPKAKTKKQIQFREDAGKDRG